MTKNVIQIILSLFFWRCRCWCGLIRGYRPRIRDPFETKSISCTTFGRYFFINEHFGFFRAKVPRNCIICCPKIRQISYSYKNAGHLDIVRISSFQSCCSFFSCTYFATKTLQLNLHYYHLQNIVTNFHLLHFFQIFPFIPLLYTSIQHN